MAGLCFTPGTFHSNWQIGAKKEIEKLCTGCVHNFIPIQSDGICVNVSKDGHVIGTKYAGKEHCEPYWHGDDREGGGYLHANVRVVDGKKYAIF